MMFPYVYRHSWSAKPDMTHASHKAGYAVSFANNFQFVTVNGAGHLVPATQPGFAIELLKKLLSGATF